MNKLQLLKAGAQLVVSVGTGSIVGNIIKATTPVSIGLITKACVSVGGLVLGSMIADKASDYTGQQIDDAVDSIFGVIKDVIVEEE